MKYKLDKDGNQVLDESGNPIEVDEETLTPEQELEKVKQENATLLQTKETLVNEVKELRSKKQLTEQERDDLATKIEELKKVNVPGEKPQVDVAQTVEDALIKRDEQSRLRNKEKAMIRFISEHPELSPSNDEAGIKKSAFDNKLSIFNMNGLNDVEEFISIFSSAYALLGKAEVIVEDDQKIVTPPITPPQPGSEDPDKLQPKELEYIKNNLGGNIDRYKELKKSQPKAIEQILASESN